MMKAMILAAGRGERMRPLTDRVPKPLAPLAGKCLIDPLLFRLSQAGVCEVVINVCYLADKIINYLGDGRNYGLKITYSVEEEVGSLETGGGIYRALPLLGYQPFLLISSDIVTDYPFETLLNKKIPGMAHLVLVDNPHFHPSGDFHLSEGAVNLRKGVRLTYASIAILHPELFANCSPGKFPLNKVFLEAIEQQMVSGEYYRGKWFNVGTLEELQNLPQELVTFLFAAG